MAMTKTEAKKLAKSFKKTRMVGALIFGASVFLYFAFDLSLGVTACGLGLGFALGLYAKSKLDEVKADFNLKIGEI